jgi:hypothetical protein
MITKRIGKRKKTTKNEDKKQSEEETGETIWPIFHAFARCINPIFKADLEE